MIIPDQETAVDFLNYEPIASTVASAIRARGSAPISIGIHGDWGAGKSSVLRMIEADFADDDATACLWFNGWAFQGFSEAKTVMIEAILSELLRQRTLTAKGKELVGSLLKRVNWLKVAKLGGTVAVNLTTGLPTPEQIGASIKTLRELASSGEINADSLRDSIDASVGLLNPAEPATVPDEIHLFREEFEQLLQEAKVQRLVVLIDDLDRCLPETAIQTLEAIRLFLFVPNTAFIIGADEGMIEYAVRRHFPELPAGGGLLPYARSYLEKLVQVPFRIPALGVAETKTYTTLLLVEQVAESESEEFKALTESARALLSRPWEGKALDIEQVLAVAPAKSENLRKALSLGHSLGPILAEGTQGNPRQIKRFLNTMLIRQAIAEARGISDRIDQAVLAKLMLAERFQEDFFRQITTEATRSPDGKSSTLLSLENVAPEPEPKARSKSETEKSNKKAEKKRSGGADDQTSWVEREWLQRWLEIAPTDLNRHDLRPYILVSRDRRLGLEAAVSSGLEGLVLKLSGDDLLARGAEQDVARLDESEASQVFSALREKLLRREDWSSEPEGFAGLRIIATHHPRLQTDLISLVSERDVQSLGFWAVKGWNSCITDSPAKEALKRLFERWANQSENDLLAKTARDALPAVSGGKR